VVVVVVVVVVMMMVMVMIMTGAEGLHRDRLAAGKGGCECVCLLHVRRSARRCFECVAIFEMEG
jgi:hypothetical protein